MDRIITRTELRKPLNQILFHIFTLLLMCTPVLAIFFRKFFGIETPFLLIVSVITIVLGIFYITTKKRIKVPSFLWLLVPYFFYKFFVDYNFHEIYKNDVYETVRANTFIVAIFFALVIIFNSEVNEKLLKILLKYVLIIIVVAPVFTIIQVYFPLFLRVDDSVTDNLIYILRRYSFFGYEDLNALGFTYLPLVFAFVGSHYFQEKKIWSVFLLLCIGIVLILSNTRYIMAGFILVLIQIMIPKKYKIATFLRYIPAIIIIAVCIYYVFNIVGYDFSEFYKKRIDDQGNINARIISFNAFTAVFPSYPFWGVGYEFSPKILKYLYGLSPKIHIGFLNHLAVYGIMGSALLFSFWIGLFKRYFSRGKHVKYWGIIFALIFFFWSNLTLVMYSIFYSGMLLALIIEKGIYRKRLLKVTTGSEK